MAKGNVLTDRVLCLRLPVAIRDIISYFFPIFFFGECFFSGHVHFHTVARALFSHFGLRNVCISTSISILRLIFFPGARIVLYNFVNCLGFYLDI